MNPADAIAQTDDVAELPAFLAKLRVNEPVAEGGDWLVPLCAPPATLDALLLESTRFTQKELQKTAAVFTWARRIERETLDGHIRSENPVMRAIHQREATRATASRTVAPPC